jgi:hypothetical protein
VERKCVLDVANSDALALDQNPHHIEPVGIVRPAMPGDPDAGRATQLLLLPPVDRFDGTAESVAAPSLDLDERHHPLSLDHEIDVAMPGAEPALDHTPSSLPKPPLRDPLPQLAE